MKKILLPALIVLAGICALCAGCAKTQNAPDASHGSALPAQSEASLPETTNAQAEAGSEEAGAFSSETRSGNASENRDAIEEELSPRRITRGKWTGTKYANKYAGLTYTMPSGWEATSDEEIAEKMGISVELLADPGIDPSNEIMGQRTLYDMIATNTTTGSTVVVTFQNLSAFQDSFQVDEETALQELQQELAAVSELSFSESYPLTLGAEPFLAADASVAQASLTQCIGVKKTDLYLIAVTITAQSGDTLESIVACFS